MSDGVLIWLIFGGAMVVGCASLCALYFWLI
jgi:hypothetical protein